MGIDTGLSAPGNTGKKTDAALFRILPLLQDHVQGNVLLLVQLRERHLFDVVRRCTPEHFSIKQLNDLPVFQRLQRCSSSSGELQEILAGKHFKAAEQINHLCLFRCLRPSGLYKCRSLVCRNGKPYHLPGFIPGFLPPGPIKPQSGRQHHTHRIIHRAEIALAHKKRKAKLLSADQRLGIRRPENFLTFRIAALFREGKNDSFRYPVSLPERNKYTDTRLYD